ncbi:succinyl-CoA synthetase, beta subunit [Desulfosporosinus acidiphilus SJ4]|uniref:Succinate--CoA ligase [ADP-forming] subunit beta n=1 Tax=Desulfosporosinus acidiphilus (strain DSM 22704 / JCM 16185 / SJ4) TaxID=646529 RepID=I4D4Z3_DESAJ|nr:ADP-forming succinate--CoA ligase subunit beta [Desulfosporosinus acidiphilus]AFM40867.1 succinyl-CoA synthetase, beta subunit [Desulfosporosinus acidiphilus SJ4]
MKLYEFMAKKILQNNGIPVPKGEIFTGVEGVAAFVEKTGPVAVKSQVLSGGRGKAGGIKFATAPQDALSLVQDLLAAEIKGSKVEKVLIEKKVSIEREIYLALTVDGAKKQPVLLASAAGGMEVEQVPEELMIKRLIDVTIGLRPYAAREIARQMGLKGREAQQVSDLMLKLYQIFRKYDAELVEINPLVVTPTQVLAADAKMTLDDDAAFRFLPEVPWVEERTAVEKKAGDLGISYVELDGDIGVMANGAGITMATLDLLKHFGAGARNFMDAGGGSSLEATAAALEILLSTNPKALLINIFGGITRCDEVAQAFVQVKNSLGLKLPVVIRLIGTNEDLGTAILQEQGIESFKNIEDAVRKVIALLNGGGDDVHYYQ